MRKHTHSVSMRCTPEQFERDLRVELEGMGIEHRLLLDATCPVLWFEHSSRRVYATGYTLPENALNHYNPALFLAIASMSEGPELYPGEWVKSKFYKYIMKVDQVNIDVKVQGVSLDGEKYGGETNCYVKLTLSELIEHFTKEQEEIERRNKESMSSIPRLRKAGEVKECVTSEFHTTNDIIFSCDFKRGEWTPVNGEEIEVSNTNGDSWVYARFVGMAKDGEYVVERRKVHPGSYFEAFRLARKAEYTTKVSKKDLISAYCSLHGVERESIEITD